jgi:hypothetical protein
MPINQHDPRLPALDAPDVYLAETALDASIPARARSSHDALKGMSSQSTRTFFPRAAKPDAISSTIGLSSRA